MKRSLLAGMTCLVTLTIVLGIVLAVELMIAARNTDASSDPFVRAVDLSPIGDLALSTTGRLKAIDSYTSTVMNEVTGPRLINGQSPTFTYIDMMLRPAEYVSRPVIYVRKKVIRERLANALLDDAPENLRAERIEWAESFVDGGLIAPEMLAHPAIAEELNRMRRDAITTAKFVDEIDFARFQMQFEVLFDGFKIVPPSQGDTSSPWLTLDAYSTLPADASTGIDADLQAQVRDAWGRLARGWLAQDATAVNVAVDELADLLPQVNPTLYPSGQRAGWPWSPTAETAAGWISSAGVLLAFCGLAVFGLVRARWRLAAVGGLLAGVMLALHVGAFILGQFDPLALESFYFKHHFRVNEVWILYLFSSVLLLMSIVYGWDWSRWSGLTIFAVAFALHSIALMLRWYVADRWPNSNMFEAVTTAAWFGGCGAVVLEVLVRHMRMRNLFALGSALSSMTAFMAAHFLPQALNANITNKMPVLNDVWLYIHTNVIIFSYVLIYMAGIVALVYLAYRLAAMLRNLPGPFHARVGGAGSLVLSPSGSVSVQKEKTTFGEVLDGATMLLVEVSFVLLWAGLVMGAMWADHSWGRPWGWDPKEVFALNTFIVFAVLIHVRLKTKDKGLWTSLLTIAGCIVMLFNWIFINFKITGLHSYA